MSASLKKNSSIMILLTQILVKFIIPKMEEAKMRSFALIIVLLSLSACSHTDTTQANATKFGAAAAGALVGGLSVAQSGQLVLTALAATVGARIGYEIGAQQLTPSDVSRFKTSAKLAMEDPRDGLLHNWVNPLTGVAGTIKPTRTYYAGDDIYCRDFEVRIAVNDDVRDSSSRACRVAGGTWYLDPNA
jgi:surface antigen